MCRHNGCHLSVPDFNTEYKPFWNPGGSSQAVSNQRKWDRHLSSAVSYQLQFGHLLVPRKGHWKPLNYWLKTQRGYKNSVPPSLSQRREVALTELGFVWNVSELKWNRKMKSIFKFFDTAYNSDTNLRPEKSSRSSY